MQEAEIRVQWHCKICKENYENQLCRQYYQQKLIKNCKNFKLRLYALAKLMEFNVKKTEVMTETTFDTEGNVIVNRWKFKQVDEYKLKTSAQKQHKSMKHTFGKTTSKCANEKANNFYVNVSIYR